MDQEKNPKIIHKKKKPDLVVWNEKRGYYQNELSYGSNLGAPAINMEDIPGWRQSNVLNVNRLFNIKYEKIKEKFNKLMLDVNWNELVYTSTFNFIPVIGNVYYLYRKEDGSYFLSIISPDEWFQEYVGSTKLDDNNLWVKL